MFTLHCSAPKLNGIAVPTREEAITREIKRQFLNTRYMEKWTHK